LLPIRIATWVLLALIALATILPIGFRPESGLPVQVERFAAFFVAGLMLMLAYRRHFMLAVVLALGAALLLEAGQLLVPTRHGGIIDLQAKVLGAICGLVAGWLLGWLWTRLRSSSDRAAPARARPGRFRKNG